MLFMMQSYWLLKQVVHVVTTESCIIKIRCFKSCCLVLTDVDTPEPDEKSLITYISSLYDVFPEPPPIHPLYDPVSNNSVY
jgi:hypothetical protein